MTAHTPGPWVITASPDRPALRWIEAPGVDIAEVRSGEVDARIMRASPETLAALEALEHEVGMACVERDSRVVGKVTAAQWSRVDSALTRARSAIARARGV